MVTRCVPHPVHPHRNDSSSSAAGVSLHGPQRRNKLSFKEKICLQREWRIFPKNNGCLERLALPTARTVPYRKWFMGWEEVRAATISSTASCRRRNSEGTKGRVYKSWKTHLIKWGDRNVTENLDSFEQYLKKSV